MIIGKSENGEIKKVANLVVSKNNLEIIDPLEMKTKSSNDLTLINNLIKSSRKSNILEKKSSERIEIEKEKEKENDRTAGQKEFQKMGPRSLIQSLTPIQVAVREPILLPTRYVRSSVVYRNFNEIN